MVFYAFRVSAVTNTINEFETIIADRNATVEDKALATIAASPDLMCQLFSNLIHNALKFAADRPLVIQVKSELGKSNEWFSHEITVSDNGIGFEERYTEKTFQVLEMLGSTPLAEGVGIGHLQGIVEHHNGFVIAAGGSDKRG